MLAIVVQRKFMMGLSRKGAVRDERTNRQRFVRVDRKISLQVLSRGRNVAKELKGKVGIDA